MMQDMTEEEREYLLGTVSDLTERGILKKEDYARILAVCKAACERRVEEIDGIIGKPCDIVQ